MATQFIRKCVQCRREYHTFSVSQGLCPECLKPEDHTYNDGGEECPKCKCMSLHHGFGIAGG